MNIHFFGIIALLIFGLHSNEASLNSSVLYTSNEYQKDYFYCQGLAIINTSDNGYLVAGVETFNYGSIRGNLSLTKYNSSYDFEYKLQEFPSFEYMIFYRLQETENYYCFIYGSKNTSLDSYKITVYRIDKKGIKLSSFIYLSASSEICRSLIFLFANDSILISECNSKAPNYDIDYTIFNANTLNVIDSIKIRLPSCMSIYCNQPLVTSGTRNPINHDILFNGIISSYLKCPKQIPVPDPANSSNIIYVTKYFYYYYYQLFTSKFSNSSSNILHNFVSNPYGTVPSCYNFLNNIAKGTGRKEDYLFLSVYKPLESNFIAMIMNGFDIWFSIIDLNQNWSIRNSFPKPSSINTGSIYPFSPSRLIYDDPYFIFAGVGQVRIYYNTIYYTDYYLIIIGAYDTSKNTGFIKTFPDPPPGICFSNNCKFTVNDLVRISASRIMISGYCRFLQSRNDEEIILAYNLQSGSLIDANRKVNNLNYAGKRMMYISDYSLVEVGNDIYGIALTKYNGKFKILLEERITLEFSVTINSAIPSNTGSFFVSGYLEKYDNTGKFGFVLEILKTFVKSFKYVFSMNSEVTEIILSSNNVIYGLCNLISNYDSILFYIGVTLREPSIRTTTITSTENFGLMETIDKYIVLVGQYRPNKFMNIMMFTMKLEKEINVPNFNKSEILKSYEIKLTSVTKTYSKNIIAIGNVNLKGSQDCITILFSSRLVVKSFDTFGTQGSDNHNHILPLQDLNFLTTGKQSDVSFLRIYTPMKYLIKENVFSLSKLSLISSMERYFRNGITVGYIQNNQLQDMRFYNFSYDMNCPSGYYIVIDTGLCKEICGDNMNLGEYECDIDDRTCCNSSCLLMPTYSIILDPITKIEKCKKEYIVNANMSIISNSIIMNFSSNMSFCDQIDSKKSTIAQLKTNTKIFIRNDSKTKYKMTILNMEYQYCDKLNITLNDKFSFLPNSKILEVDIKGAKFIDIYGIGLSDTEFSSKLVNIKANYISGSYAVQYGTISFTQRVLVGIGVSSSFISSFLGQGITEIFNFMGPIQIIMLFSMINVKPYPEKAKSVISANSIISFNIDIFTGKIFKKIEDATKSNLSYSIFIDDNSKIHPSLNSINLFFNTALKIVIIIMFPSIFLSIYFISLCFPSLDPLLDSFTWNGFIKLFHGVYFEFLICSLMQLYHQYSSFTWLNNLQNAFAFIFIASIFLYFLKIYAILLKITPEKLELKGQKVTIGALYNHTRIFRDYAKYQILVYYLRRVFSLIVLFSFVNYPMYQAILFGLVSVLNLIFLIIVKPIENRITEVGNIITEIIIITIHIDFCLVAHFYNVNNLKYVDSLVNFFIIGTQVTTLMKVGISFVKAIYLLLKIIKKYYKFNSQNSQPDTNADGSSKNLNSIDFKKNKNIDESQTSNRKNFFQNLELLSQVI